jgi:anti-anti-sigma factor
MELWSYPNDEGHVVKVTGELTAAEPLTRLPNTVERIVEHGSPKVVKLDVPDVEMVDLEGIAALVKARQSAVRNGVRFKLVDGQPRVRSRLEVTGLLRLLEEEEL